MLKASNNKKDKYHANTPTYIHTLSAIDSF